MTAAETTSIFATTPSEELVRNATRELGWDERFTLYEMSASTGNTPVVVYNFQRLVVALFGTHWDRLLYEGTKEKLVWFDFGELTAWIRDVLGDAELADAIDVAIADIEAHKARVDAVLPVFRERIAQYHAVLDEIGRDEG